MLEDLKLTIQGVVCVDIFVDRNQKNGNYFLVNCFLKITLMILIG